MSSVTLQLPDDKAERLTRAAQEMGISVEELLDRITDDFLNRKHTFETAARYVLDKNADLYQRLAQ